MDEMNCIFPTQPNYFEFKVNGAGTITMTDMIIQCKGEQGIHIHVSWGKHGSAGGNIPKEEALKLANHILKVFGIQSVQIDEKQLIEGLIKIIRNTD